MYNFSVCCVLCTKHNETSISIDTEHNETSISIDRSLKNHTRVISSGDSRVEKIIPRFVAGTKDTDKGRLYFGRSSSEDTRAKSPLSGSKSSLLEKYSFSAGKTSERPSSVLDRYNRPASREKSREPEGISRYGSSTYPGSSFGRSYGNDGKIEKKDHPPPVSYRGLRPNSGRASREPSPEVAGAGKTNSFRVYSRASSYGRSAASPSKYDYFIAYYEEITHTYIYMYISFYTFGFRSAEKCLISGLAPPRLS